MSILRMMTGFLIIIIGAALYLNLHTQKTVYKEPELIEPEPLNYDFQRSQALHYLNQQRKAAGLISLELEPLLGSLKMIALHMNRSQQIRILPVSLLLIERSL